MLGFSSGAAVAAVFSPPVFSSPPSDPTFRLVETEPSFGPPPEEPWDDPEDDEPDSRQEEMLRDKFIATFTEAAARASRKP